MTSNTPWEAILTSTFWMWKAIHVPLQKITTTIFLFKKTINNVRKYRCDGVFAVSKCDNYLYSSQRSMLNEPTRICIYVKSMICQIQKTKHSLFHDHFWYMQLMWQFSKLVLFLISHFSSNRNAIELPLKLILFRSACESLLMFLLEKIPEVIRVNDVWHGTLWSPP